MSHRVLGLDIEGIRERKTGIGFSTWNMRRGYLKTAASELSVTNAYNSLVGKPEEKRPLEKLDINGRIIIIMALTEVS